MKIIWNILLGIFALLSAAVLLLQGFALPALAPWVDLLLRISAAFFTQWLFLRLFRRKWLRTLPVALTALAAVWGFFLYLSSPSWRGATFGLFMHDYAAFMLSCAAVWALGWLLPRLVPRVKKAIKAFFRRRKKGKASKKDMPKFR